MLKFTIADTLRFQSNVFNAAGPGSRNANELEGISKSGSAAVVSKSATLFPDLTGYWGNEGIDYYIDKTLIEKLTATEKPYIVSISTANIEEILPMLDKVLLQKQQQQQQQQQSSGEQKKKEAGGAAAAAPLPPPFVSAIELNLSCGESALVYDAATLDSVLAEVTAHQLFATPNSGTEEEQAKRATWSKASDLVAAASGVTRLGVKIPPFYDKKQLDTVAEIFAAHPSISFVVAVNTISNALAVDTDLECEAAPPACSNSNGYCLQTICDNADCSCDIHEMTKQSRSNVFKHTALANMRQLYLAFQRLGREDIALIGVGGVNTGKDAFEFILCGATAVQLGSCFFKEGVSAFERVQAELADIMKTRGYDSVEAFQGSLKPYGTAGTEKKSNGSSSSSSSTGTQQHGVDLKLSQRIRSLFSKPDKGWRSTFKEAKKTLFNERAALYAAVALLAGAVTVQQVAAFGGDA